MRNYEAIKNLAPELLEKLFDQVFLTGFNTGFQSLVDPGIYDGNPFDAVWLNEDVEKYSALVENDAGESLIIEPLVKVIMRIAEFDMESIADDISWHSQVVLPRCMEDEDAEEDIE